MGRKATGRNPVNMGSAAGLLSNISTSAGLGLAAKKNLPRGVDVNFLRSLVKHYSKLFLLYLIFSLFAVINASAADVTVAWDANSESDLAGYIFYYGTSSGNYTFSEDVGSTTSYTAMNLTAGETYYFAAKAYDTANNESTYSQELVHTIPVPNSAPNTPAQPSGQSDGYVQSTYSYDTSATDPDGDLLSYRFDWGDASISAWGGAYFRTHAYTAVGTYCLKAQAQDTHAATSAWSACLNVAIDIQKHTITASAGLNGSISPAGPVAVNNGADQSFSISPDQDYRIADIVVDGSSVGSSTTYVFNNVDQGHTIEAIFVLDNQPPVSRVGADQAVAVTATVQLDGSGSSDIDGDTLSNAWSIISRPGGSNASLSNAAAVNPSFVADAAGNYVVQLIVNDGTVNSHADTVTISTQNSAPLADAGADQTRHVTDTVQLDGSGSSDMDGNSLSYTWSFASRPDGSNAALSDARAVKPTFDIDVAGTYTVQLIVNDGTVNSVPDTVAISTENSAPVADAAADQAVRINDKVQLDGSGSSDVDGDILTYLWSFVAKPAGSNAALSDTNVVNPAFDVDIAGTYALQLIVNDGSVNSAPDTVTISTENAAPVSNAGADQAVMINDTVQLDGSGSGDADGDSLTFAWSFASRPIGSKTALSDTNVEQPSFVVDVTGTYTLQLIVNDGSVNSTPDTVTISTDNSAPVSDAGTDQVVRINDMVQLDGDGSSDADGDTLTFKWSVISKPGGSNASLSSTIDRNPTFSIDAAGTYTMQLIVYDGTDYSAPDTVTIVTENAAPVSNAGNDQTVDEGDTVTLSGLASTDPDDNIAGYSWEQTGGVSVALSNFNSAETTFIAPVPATDSETLTFQLTIQDGEGLLDVDTCNILINRTTEVDSDGDGVPDNQDAFPTDPDESLDTDGDGEGNNADTDDDNDGMPDTWELLYGLDPLKDDAAADPDGDDVSNINEYHLGSKPDHFEGNFLPDTPDILTPENSATVSLTPLLETGEFNDPNINDVHRKTQWKIRRAFDDVCVFDVSTAASLTSIVIPKQILEEDTEYIWQARFIDSHDTPSQWSEERDFITDLALYDLDKNGVPDDQEVLEDMDLDKDGTTDTAQSDMKCVSVEAGTIQICISIRDAENAVSIISLEVEDPNDPQLASKKNSKPNFFEFGMLDFKLLVNNPGDETTVTIYLSQKAYTDGNCFKYDPVNGLWLDYSDYTRFSPNRKEVYLTLIDGGFGDADGIENGIIVDPLAFGSETDPSGGSSGSPIDEILDGIIPNDLSCFISVAAGDSATNRPGSAWHLTRTLEFWLILMLPFLLYLFKTLVVWILTMENRMKNRPEPGDSQA